MAFVLLVLTAILAVVGVNPFLDDLNSLVGVLFALCLLARFRGERVAL